MVTITTNYIVYTPGHRRHHAGSQTQLVPTVSGTATAGDSYPVTAFASLPYMGANLPFAFMAVSGAANGSQLYTNPGTRNIAVGSTNIKVLVVYAPAGGIGGNGVGVFVDAFNVDICDFSDSDFMSVYNGTTLNGALTAAANNDGVVPSDEAQDLRSYNAVDSVPFLQWQKLGGATVNVVDYNLARLETGFVLAFYQTPAPINIPRPDDTAKAGYIYVSPGVLVDAGGVVIGPDGKPHPVGPWGPLVAKLLSTVTILSAATNMTKAVQVKATSLAVDHLNSVARSLKEGKIKQG